MPAGPRRPPDDMNRRVCGLFFFQAEDGIRDVAVTGVQTCALPILRGCQRGWQALDVFLGLELDARERVAGGLGLHHAKSVAVDEEQVVDVAVALLQDRKSVV